MLKRLKDFRGDHVRMVEKVILIFLTLTILMFVVDLVQNGYVTAVWKLPSDLVKSTGKTAILFWVASIVCDVYCVLKGKDFNVWGDDQDEYSR